MDTIWTFIAGMITSLVGAFVEGVNQITTLFFTISAEGAWTIQPLGYFAFIGLGIWLLRTIVNFVTRFISSRLGAGRG